MTVNTEVLDPQVPEEDVSGHDTKRGGMDPALLGMMLFIASEVMFFAALFAAYFNAKATLPVFPPEGPEGAEAVSLFHVPYLPILMTILLIQLVHDAVGHDAHPRGRPHRPEPRRRHHPDPGHRLPGPAGVPTTHCSSPRTTSASTAASTARSSTP